MAVEAVTRDAGQTQDAQGRFARAMALVTGQSDAATRAIQQMTDHIRAVAETLIRGIAAPFVAAGNTVRSAASQIGSMFPSWTSRPFQAAGRTVASATSAMVSGVGAGLSRVGGLAASAGKSLAAGIGNGAREAAKDVGFIAITATATALAVATAKAGLEFNTLDHASRASLTILLGSTEAANEQMAKLDAFVKQSSFSKAVFINAQRQMLGFGIVTDNVLPTLDAIQNFVAAVGGTNDDIASIVDTFAKIQSAGKRTGEDLQSLGA